MVDQGPPQWLAWAREIQALSQTGLHYAANDYQRERNKRLTEIAAEIISWYTEIDFPIITNLFRGQVGYATPRVDIRGAVFHEGRLLLVKERIDGGWTMPGGWADVGDIPSESVEREVLEESGFRVSAKRLIGVYDANRVGPMEIFHAYKIIFLCEILAGNPRTSYETTEVAFFDYEQIPRPLSGERTKPRHIQDAFSAFADPMKLAVFD
jgi:ADP-ribose pyrophosphatase YjhB (NUDIX family)